MKTILTLASIALAVPLLVAQSTPSSQPISSWVQMTAAGAQLRVIVPNGSACPVARIHGKPLPLALRAEPEHASPDFPATCQVTLPSTAKHVTVDGRFMPIPGRVVRKIVVIGDTGCRVTGGEQQDCSQDWPFEKIASFAAAQHPDLVIHVGDYYYREKCEGGAKHCENWENWRRDFFDPAHNLLNAAPWVFARGNHETCARAAQGWFRYLDAADAPIPCLHAKSAAFLVPLQGLTLDVLDTADTPDAWLADRKLQSFQQDIKPLHVSTGTPQWIITHKPPFVQGFMNPKFDGKATESDPNMPGVELILAGHLHLFGSMNFGPDRPGQLIVGDSGTRLMVSASDLDKKLSAKNPKTMMENKSEIDGKQADVTMKGRFGYFILERATPTAKLWKGSFHGIDDTVMAHCTIEGREVHCAPAK